MLLRAEVSGDASPGKYFRILLHGRGRKDPGFLAALQAVLGYSTIAVTERHGTVGDDLAKRKAPRLVQYRAQAQGQGWSGEGAPISVT